MKLKSMVLSILLLSMLTIITLPSVFAGVFDPVAGVYTWQWEPYGPRMDDLYFKIIDWGWLTPAQELYVDSFDGTHVGWTTVGESPYLNAVDYPNNYIKSNTYSSNVGFFSFEDMAPLGAGEEIKGVTIEAYAWSDGPEIDGDIYIFGADFSWVWVGSIEASTTWSWVFPSYVDEITAYADTPEKIADLKVLFHYWTPDESSGPTIKIDALKLNVYTRTLEEAQVTELQTGEIDVLTDLAPGNRPGPYVSRLEQDGFTTTVAPSFNMFGMYFNMRDYTTWRDDYVPLSDQVFRHAVAHLVPKDAIVKALYNTLEHNTTRVDTYVPPAFIAWLNPDVDPHPYNPDEAKAILTAGGYVYDETLTNPVAGVVGNWIDPAIGQPMNKMYFWVRDTMDYQIQGPMIVAEMQAIGLPVEVKLVTRQTWVESLSYYHDFDMISCGWGLGADITWLYTLFHSSEDVVGGRNIAGIRDPELDALLEEIMFGLDPVAIKDAVSSAQVMLSELLPYPITGSWNNINAFDSELEGIINMHGYGSDNDWTFLNSHWEGVSGGTLKWGLAGEPHTLNPLFAGSGDVPYYMPGSTNSRKNGAHDNPSKYEWEILDRVYEGLIAVNPGTGDYMPWLANDWTVEPWTAPGDVPGMKMTFWLGNDVSWHDGVQFTAEDVKFALEYIQQHQIPNSHFPYASIWQNLVEVVIPEPQVVEIHFSTRNYWLLDDVARIATLLPKHIWQDVTDPAAFRPWEEPHPTVEGLTKLIGTGPFVFIEYVPGNYAYLKANPSYFMRLAPPPIVPNPDHMIVATIYEPESVDPTWEYYGSELTHNVYDTLISFDVDRTLPPVEAGKVDQIVPSLATEWTISPNGLRYTFKIRGGVKFHNGEILTTEDVEYSFERAMVQGGGPWGGPIWMLYHPLLGVGRADMNWPSDESNPINQAVQSNSTHVWFNLVRPYTPFLSILAQPWASIINRQWTIAQGDWDGNWTTWKNYHNPPISPLDDPEPVMMGTGPYKFDYWTRGVEWSIVKFDDYWQGWPAPGTEGFVSRATVKLVPDWPTRKEMFLNGSADIVYVPKLNISELIVDPGPPETYIEGVRCIKDLPTLQNIALFFNFDIPSDSPYIGTGTWGTGIPTDFFSDIDVRKAFAYSFNYTQLIEDVLLGEAIQPSSPVVKGLPYHNPDNPKYAFDLTKAEEHFRAAWGGQVWEKGFTFTIPYNWRNVIRETAAYMIKDNVEALNPKFHIDVMGVDWPTYLGDLLNLPLWEDSLMPEFLIGWLYDYPDPHNFVEPFMHSQGIFALLQSYSNATVDSLIEEGLRTLDPTRRQEIYYMLQLMYYQDVPSVPLYQRLLRHWERDWVQGWYYNPTYPGRYFYHLWKALPPAPAPPPPAVLPATVDIDPDTLNLKSKGQWITAYIELPDYYDVADIVLDKVYLTYQGLYEPAVTDPQYGFVTDRASYIVDNDGDGILERLVKFDRTTFVVAYLNTMDYEEDTGLSEEVTLTIVGKLVDETPFEASDTIRLIYKGK